MSKFNVGDEVVVISGITKGMQGVIQEECNKTPLYRIKSRNGIDCYIQESCLKEKDLLDEPIGEYVEPEISEDDYYTEMATVKGGFMSIKITIYGDEGTIPHFHFYKGIAPEHGISKEKRNGGGCICIDSASYFMHGNHVDTLDRKEIDGLFKFLKSPHKLLKEYTNWQYIISEWDQNNPDQKQLSIDLPIPDYKSDMKTIQNNNK